MTNIPNNEPLLKASDLDVFYGAIHALKGVSFEVHEGEIVSLIGANGAGKTTTLQTVSGLLRARSGAVTFKGLDISKTAPHKILSLGLSQCPEGRRMFSQLSVEDNLMLGAYSRTDRKGILEDRDSMFKRFPRLAERRSQKAGTLSGGEQQMVAIARALMSRPTLLLLDEPSMGLAPLLVKEIFATIKDVAQNGTTILLVEQNARMALKIASRAYVLETGNVVLSGEAKDLLNNEGVKRAYLGG